MVIIKYENIIAIGAFCLKILGSGKFTDNPLVGVGENASAEVAA